MKIMKPTTMAATSIPLLFLLLAAVVVAADAAAATIQLPSEPNSRPWDCCEDLEMSPLRIYPPRYRCNDVVEQCSAACETCAELIDGGGYVCKDWFGTTDPGTFCKERPWGKCCDLAVCTRAYIPTCQCADQVAQCAPACEVCERVEPSSSSSSSRPPLFVCRDWFKGNPGPVCTPAQDTRY